MTIGSGLEVPEAAIAEICRRYVEKSIWSRSALCGMRFGGKSWLRPASFMRRERLYLEDILAAADAIAEFVEGQQSDLKGIDV